MYIVYYSNINSYTTKLSSADKLTNTMGRVDYNTIIVIIAEEL